MEVLMNRYEKIIFILLFFGFVFSSYGSVYQTEQNSQEEGRSCPFLFSVITDQNVNMQIIRDMLSVVRVNPNVSLEGCRGDEFYDSLPEGSTLPHAAAHLEHPRAYSIYNLLKRYGANEEATDENGNTPSDIREMMRMERLGR